MEVLEYNHIKFPSLNLFVGYFIGNFSKLYSTSRDNISVSNDCVTC